MLMPRVVVLSVTIKSIMLSDTITSNMLHVIMQNVVEPFLSIS